MTNKNTTSQKPLARTPPVSIREKKKRGTDDCPAANENVVSRNRRNIIGKKPSNVFSDFLKCRRTHPPSPFSTGRCIKGIILPRKASRTWDDAVPEADNSKERAEKIDKF